MGSEKEVLEGEGKDTSSRQRAKPLKK